MALTGLSLTHPVIWGNLSPRDSLRRLGYWFTPTLSTSTHFSHRPAFAQGAFALIRPLSPSAPLEQG